MRKFLNILKYTVAILVFATTALLCYLRFAIPAVGAPESVKVASTPERIERGKYLTNSVCACTDCHSTRDWNKFAGPVVENTLGKGGEAFDQKSGFPGIFYAKNITPFALGNWTDGEIIRAITCGVRKNGTALFPEMSYLVYGTLDKEDIYAIVAYIRTLTPVKNVVPESKPDFPMNFIINTMPHKANFNARPDSSNIVAYGNYLFKAAGCISCHSQQEDGHPIAGMELAGGFKFHMPTGGTLYSANITPDKETGIGNWTEFMFVNRFKAYADSGYKPASLVKGDFNTLMPWLFYCNMKPYDLKAIYAYLQTVKPVRNAVTRFIPGED